MRHRKTTAIDRSAAIGLALVVLAGVIHLALVVAFNFTQDDAYISFRYAANYLNGHGLVYNIGERVEGYTNFLWTMLLIVGRLIGFDFVLFSRLLGAACGLGTIAVLFFLAKDTFSAQPRKWGSIYAGLSCLILGAAYSFAYWTVAGLETAAFSLMTLGAIYAYTRRSAIMTPCLVAATLLRPEGILIFACLAAYDLLSQRRPTSFLVQTAVLYAVFVAPFLIFKWSYYHSLLPNPFYAKTSFSLEQMANGAEYVGQFFWHYLAAGIFLIPALMALRKGPVAVRLIMFFLSVYLLYVLAIGGDVLKVHRFMVPILAPLAVAIVYGMTAATRKRLLTVGGVVVVLAWQAIVPYSHVTTFHFHEKGLTSKMQKIVDALQAVDSSDFSIALSTIGLAGYRLLDHTVIDLLGLTDSTVARHPEAAVAGLESTWRESHFNSRYVLSRQPDYILFSTGLKPSAPAERALYLYSAFLSSYRTIGFYFGTGTLHAVYKRYRPIPENIQRDVDVRFVQNFNRGINLLRDNSRGVLEAMYLARSYSPRPVYPYVNYYISLAQRDLGDIEASYRSLKEIVRDDSLVYQGFMDLYLYEYRLGNYDAARYYRSKTAALVPWYIPRLDSVVINGPKAPP